MLRMVSRSPISERCKSGIMSIMSSRAVLPALSWVASSSGVDKTVRMLAASATRGLLDIVAMEQVGFISEESFNCIDSLLLRKKSSNAKLYI